jgi:fibro-slime domain-containing protein
MSFDFETPTAIRAHRALGVFGAVSLVALTLSGCGSSSSSSGAGGFGNGTGGSILNLGGSGNGTGNGGAGVYVLPQGFTASEIGGYKLGEAFNSDTPPSVGGAPGANASGCGTTIVGIVRDFIAKDDPNGHPDFQAFAGNAPTVGMVENNLGTDQKPVYTGICQQPGKTQACPYDQQTTTKANYDQWYRYTADVNRPYVLYLSLQPSDNGNLTYQSHAFFPLDGAGWGNYKNTGHNFHFTTEVHTEFKYSGGEQFKFIGDDDVWVFINHKLAVDLGGLHPEATGSIILDDQANNLGISKGNTYPLDLFHAERHTDQSNFRVDTNLQFTNCGIFVPEPPPQ